MNSLDKLPAILDSMISSQKEKKSKTCVAKYKDKNLIMRSGKSSWKQIGHAKSAITNHFHSWECEYKWDQDLKYGHPDYYQIVRNREKQFRTKLFELIEIVELKD